MEIPWHIKVMMELMCKECAGSGAVCKAKCQECNGTGLRLSKKK